MRILQTPCSTLCALVLIPTLCAAQTEWDVAASKIERLSPSDFPGLPAGVGVALEGMGCEIPQAWGTTGPHNLISGFFATQGQVDWAALCSVGGRSAIVIHWGGVESCPSPVAAPLEDQGFLQQTGVDGILYSRGIDRIRPDLRFWTAPEDFKDDSFSHDAISDAFFEKGATAYYCQGGRWLEFGDGH